MRPAKASERTVEPAQYRDGSARRIASQENASDAAQKHADAVSGSMNSVCWATEKGETGEKDGGADVSKSHERTGDTKEKILSLALRLSANAKLAKRKSAAPSQRHVALSRLSVAAGLIGLTPC